MLLSKTKNFAKLNSLAGEIVKSSTKELFTNNPTRKSDFQVETDGLKLDYSKNLLDQEILDSLIELAGEIKLRQAITDMFTGKKINQTENRAVLHVALRNVSNSVIEVDGNNVMPEINAVLNQVYEFAENIRTGAWVGASGKHIKNIVNIGIGGSSLGPEMAYEALKYYSDRELTFRFVSNVDPADFYEKTIDLNPEETLFIVASKTFTTLETMTNAYVARDWLVEHLGKEAISRHFVAVSTNQDEVEKFGILPEATFKFWDFVGGRYSLMSSIGLSLAIAIGKDGFEDMRKGAYSMDSHFETTEFSKNLPVLLGLIGVWNRNFLDIPTEAIIPYSQYLNYLPDYLQQASMESNGKSVSIDAQKLDYKTAPVLWGGVGTNAQHSFHQLLHQGSDRVAIDFIGFDKSLINQQQHDILNANLHAQAEALAFGETAEELTASGTEKTLIASKVVTGSKPCNLITASVVKPYTLGQLIALYEHKIFVQGIIWGINSFDQFGVELGKKLAKKLMS